MSGTFRIVPLLPSPVKACRNGRRKQHTVRYGHVERGHESDSGTCPRALGGLEGSPAAVLAGPERSGAGRHPTAGRSFCPAETPVSFCCIAIIHSSVTCNATTTTT